MFNDRQLMIGSTSRDGVALGNAVCGGPTFHKVSRGLTAALPMENLYCSCKLTLSVMAHSCNPYP